MTTTGNPIMPGCGLCDPHVRVFDGRAWLYATHDASPDNKFFRMDDWWIWSSADLVNWQHEGRLRPEETYWGKPCASCWAVDAAERSGCHYLGPYRYRGSIVTEEHTDPIFRNGLLMDRHGRFFDFRGRHYFICNDQSYPGSTMFYRNSIIAEVHYSPEGDILPIRITDRGVEIG